MSISRSKNCDHDHYYLQIWRMLESDARLDKYEMLNEHDQLLIRRDFLFFHAMIWFVCGEAKQESKQRRECIAFVFWMLRS